MEDNRIQKARFSIKNKKGILVGIIKDKNAENIAQELMEIFNDDLNPDDHVKLKLKVKKVKSKIKKSEKKK